MDALEAILTRRTHKVFSGEPVSDEDVHTLLKLATFAPNHRMTEPWRFYVLRKQHMKRFTEVVTGAITADDHEKLQRKKVMLEKRLPLLGAYITVGRVPTPEEPMLDKEDYAACCCAVQNLMIGATALGIGSFWSTGKIFDRPAVRTYLGIPDELERVASIWLGGIVQEAKYHRTDVAHLTEWI
jgi:nitroreductase